MSGPAINGNLGREKMGLDRFRAQLIDWGSFFPDY